MFNLALKGGFETEDPEKLIASIQKAVQDANGTMYGHFQITQLAPYVDYQNADVTDA